VTHPIKAAEENTIYIYDPIAAFDYWGGASISAKDVIAAIDELKDAPQITVRINCPGGDVFEGDAIYNALRRASSRGAKVLICIDGVAASAASFIAMAGDEVEIAENAFIMVHEAWTYAMGNKSEIAKTVELLGKIDEVIGKIIAARSGQSLADVDEWLKAETWFSADEAVEKKLADRIGTKLKTPVTDATARMAARWSKTPAALSATIAAMAKPTPKTNLTPRLDATQKRIRRG
jgi:ATP-dependent Clp protease, protease subunit